MRLSEILSKAAKEEAERKRLIENPNLATGHTAERNRVWDAFHAACEFVVAEPTGVAAWKWANLIIEACVQLKAAGDVKRLERLRYDGTDAKLMAGTEAAYHVCQLACGGKLADVMDALRSFLDGNRGLENPFRLYLESVRDNRRLWATGSAIWR